MSSGEQPRPNVLWEGGMGWQVQTDSDFDAHHGVTYFDRLFGVMIVNTVKVHAQVQALPREAIGYAFYGRTNEGKWKGWWIVNDLLTKGRSAWEDVS